MRFSRLELTNFRSFGPGKVEVEFPDNSSLLAVVGTNNAGKSDSEIPCLHGELVEFTKPATGASAPSSGSDADPRIVSGDAS